MKNHFRHALAGALVLSIILCPAYAASFPDVEETAEYAEAVDYISEIGIMEGDNNGNFNPNNTVTRAEMAAIVCRVLGETDNLTISAEFTDVPIEHWANGYISKAAELGIVMGDGIGSFFPADNVTYEQAVTMIIRTVGGEVEAEDEGGYQRNGLVLRLLQRKSYRRGSYRLRRQRLVDGIRVAKRQQLLLGRKSAGRRDIRNPV